MNTNSEGYDRPKICFIIRGSNGIWSRGDSLSEAFKGMKGTMADTNCTVDLITGDDTAEVDRYGALIRDAGSFAHAIGKGAFKHWRRIN